MRQRARPALVTAVAAATAAAAALGLGLAAPSPSGAAGRPASYRGHTSERAGRYGVQTMPDNLVTFSVSGGRVRDFTIPWEAPCFDNLHGRPDAPLIDLSAFDPLVLRGGRFGIPNGGYQSHPGPHQTANVQLVLTGAIHGREATGTLRINAAIRVDGVYTADFCSTRTPIRWRATLTR